jgi:uncharacterized membrane protein
MSGIVASSADEKAPVVSDRGIVLAVYVLYLLGFFTGISALIGVVIAHVRASTADVVSASHFRFQVRTFWFGAISFVFGWILWHFLIGIPLLAWWFVWTLVRVIRGLSLLNDGKPVPRPRSWLFGGTGPQRRHGSYQ